MDERRLQSLLLMTNQIRRMTEFVHSAELSPEESLPTASDLARLMGVKDHDVVKKSLKYLKDVGLIRTLGLSPKRYSFDAYAYNQLLAEDTDDELLQEILTQLEALETSQVGG